MNDYKIILLASLAAMIVTPFIIRYGRVRREVKMAGTSLLLSYYTDSVSLLPLEKGLFGTLHYATFAGLSHGEIASASSVIYEVILPYASYLHLVGIPKVSGATQLDPTGGNSVMEEVVLEGDYPDYFQLYTEKGMEVDSRYTLNPKAMVFTIDFCRQFSWEIVDNELYIISDAKVDSHTADMAALVRQFVREIAPAIQKPLTAQQLALVTPYSDDYRADLKCPTCQSALVNEQGYLACPHGDGVLLKGTALTRLHAGSLRIPQNFLSNKTTQTTEVINCPGCGNPMEKVHYNGGGSTIIDACIVCPYRWLDASDQIR